MEPPRVNAREMAKGLQSWSQSSHHRGAKLHRMGDTDRVVPATGVASVQRGAVRPAAAYAALSACRSCNGCASRTGVAPAVRTGSVHGNRPNPAAPRRASIGVRNSVKWTARTRIARPDRVVGEWRTGRPGSLALTRIDAEPAQRLPKERPYGAGRRVTCPKGSMAIRTSHPRRAQRDMPTSRGTRACRVSPWRCSGEHTRQPCRIPVVSGSATHHG